MEDKVTYQDLENQISQLKIQNEIIAENYSLKNEGKYQALFNNMIEGFARCQMVYKNNKPIDFMYIEVNNAFEKLTGLKNVEGKFISELIADHKTENSILFNLYDNVAKTGISERIETFVAPLERWFSISVYSSKIGEFLVIFNNITEHKQSEQALIESESRLIELNNTKDILYSIIAHDLRSPFNSILGFSDLLINTTESEGFEKIQKFSSLIYSTARNTLVLLDNLLDWEKTQTGQINFNPEKLNLSTVIKNVIKIKTSNAIIKNISLNFNPSNIAVFADQNMLKTVLRNLISNAIKFTNLNGEININTIQSQDYCEISILDNGVGMDSEKCNNLFKIDINVTTKGTEGEKGSGLGLLLCKEFVEKNKGKIIAESELGKGSNFMFTLPLSKS